jgi:hypothetical protein
MRRSIWHVDAVMPLFYVTLFMACLTGVCAFVVIGGELRRVYVDWCERRDIFRNEPRLSPV